MMMKTFFFILSCLVLASCANKNKVPPGILRPREMQSVLWDVIRAQSLSTEFARKDSSINEVAETKLLTGRVFEIHKIDSAVFNKSYAWYTSHPDVMRVVFDSLNNQNQYENISEMQQKNKRLRIKSLKKTDPE